LLDPAIVRAGRFDTHLYVGPPNEQARFDIISKLITKMSLGGDIDTNFISMLARDTADYSGADLASLCREAGLFCLRENLENTEIKAPHFIAAKQKIPPSLRTSKVNLHQNTKLK
jgi:transitional endoplasmic reticulum ATPase